MNSYTRRLIALAIALALLGGAVAYAAGVLDRGRSQAEAAVLTAPDCRKHRLTQRQILRLGHGPLTERAARALVCGPRRRP